MNLVLKNCIRVTGHEISHAKFIPGGITADGRPVTVKDRINAGQTLRVILPESLSRGGKAAAPDLPESRIIPQPVSFTADAEGKQILPEDPTALSIPVLYEDEDILVVDKPAGQVVHPTHGHYLDTTLNYIAGFYERQGMDVIPRLAGRLDRETSGVLLVAKNRAASGRLQRQRSAGTLVRTYLALVYGIFTEKDGIIDAPIAPNPDSLGKMFVPKAGEKGTFFPSLTRYQVVEESDEISLLRVTIDTGRMHQIRAHMASIGHPLVGDCLYGNKRCLATVVEPNAESCQYSDMSTSKAGRTMLHAAQICLYQPFKGFPLTVCAKLPEDFESIRVSITGNDLTEYCTEEEPVF